MIDDSRLKIQVEDSRLRIKTFVGDKFQLRSGDRRWMELMINQPLNPQS